MSHPVTLPLPHDPNDKCRYSLNTERMLTVGDSLLSCHVYVEHGTATISSSASGGTTEADASINGSIATIWVTSAAVGDVRLRWQVTTSLGDVRNVRTALVVEPA